MNRGLLAPVLVAVCLWMTLPATGQELSSIPGAFADVGIGARAAALGYTGVASERGASAMAWNPASLASDQGMELTFSYVDQVELVEFGHVAWVMPFRSGRSAWGLSAHVSGDDMLREMTARIAYSHRIRFLWLGVGLGYRLADFGDNTLSSDDYVVFDPDEVSVGLSRQVNGTASGFLVDLGMRVAFTHRLDMAVAARNVAAPMEWTTYSEARAGAHSYFESIPLEISTGVAYRLSDRLGGYLEWTPNISGDAIPRFGLGVSFEPMDEVTFRVGRLMTQDRRRDEWKTFGFGIRTPKGLGWSIEADYAFIVSHLARTQQISLRFGL
jgi:hypothetical protein